MFFTPNGILLCSLLLFSVGLVICEETGRHYIFGYGSLINADSIAKTGKTGTGYPVRIHGLKRSWGYNAYHTSKPNTALAVQIEKGYTTNGQIMEIDGDELKKFDMRELHYARVRLDWADVEFLRAKAEELVDFTSSLWVWVIGPLDPSLEVVITEKVQHELFSANQTLPVIQSYVDTCLSGCLELERNGTGFADEFIMTTYGWDSYRLNDRKLQSETTHRIDELLLMHGIPKIELEESHITRTHQTNESSKINDDFCVYKWESTSGWNMK